jgi:hypothetical protein
LWEESAENEKKNIKLREKTNDVKLTAVLWKARSEKTHFWKYNILFERFGLDIIFLLIIITLFS